MVHEMVRRELRGRYQKSVLGFLWNFLNPVFQILIYWAIFTYIFPSQLPNYAVYLSTGLIPWTFFSEALAAGTASIAANGDMVKKIYFPREVLVISSTCAKLINLVISLFIVTIFIILSGLISGHRFGFRYYGFLIPVVLIEFVLALGFSLLLAAIDVYLRDMEYIINIIMMAWIWGTPIMYDINTIGSYSFLKQLVLLNPMTPIVMGYHDIMYYSRMPDFGSLLPVLLFGIALTIFGEFVFLHAEKNFAEEL